MKRFATCATFILSVLAGCSTAPPPVSAPIARPTVSAPAPAPAPAPSATPTIAFNAAAILAGKDSFAVAVGGQTVGSSVMTLTREGGNYRLVTDNSLPQFGIHETENVTFSAATMAPATYTAQGMMQGMAINSDVTVTTGHAKGTAQEPGSGGVKTTNVDLAISPDVVSDDAIIVLIRGLPLTDSFTASYKSFHATPGEVLPVVVSVTGRETVTVPAGTFETFRVQIDQKDPSTVFVTITSPHRVVLGRLNGGQIEMRLAK